MPEFLVIDFLPVGPLIDLGYADDTVLFGEDIDKMQIVLVALSNNARMFGMRLISPIGLVFDKISALIQEVSLIANQLMRL